ncbi:ArnT family glycosyltransferase [Hymenobacter cavernae]|uniref:Glycosyltransferase RgtA/B/C/D-like domain-containing protein n=1 Tax=Hymenobacter cavernae TaxID=2044852 RepID=A0ABQ1UFV7_9BACT|nr:glycosyltransferase family 39 protein [Hymenobacter cavernae]GGF16419.1 hypothetical protein GCM10011383_29770 [Hymenobacter cavernae]
MPLSKTSLRVLVAALLLAVAPLFFHDLGKMPLFLWDEARVAVNSAWILRTGDWLTMRADGEPGHLGPKALAAWTAPQPARSGPWRVARPIAPPDLWNTKPPLMPWLQALGMRVLGPTEVAIRLPAAVSGWLTVCFLVYFGWSVLKNPGVGVLSGLILATMPLFNGEHVARSGDYDAPLALFITVYVLSCWAYLHTQRIGYLSLTLVGLALALLAKCAAACLPLPALGIYVFWKHRAVLRQARVWLASGLGFVPLLVYYIVREQASPGYLAATWHNDWVGRFGQPLTPMFNPWWSYLRDLFYPYLSLWSPVLMGCVAVLPARVLPRYLGFLCWQVAGVLVLLMLAKTRTPVYAAQVLPFLALIIAGLLWALRDYGASRWQGFRTTWNLGILLLIGAEAAVLWHSHNHLNEARRYNSYMAYRLALRKLQQATLPTANLLLVREDFNSCLDFYLLTLPATYPLAVSIRPATPNTFKSLSSGQQVLSCWPEFREQLAAVFELQPTARVDDPCWCVRLGRRVDSQKSKAFENSAQGKNRP